MANNASNGSVVAAAAVANRAAPSTNLNASGDRVSASATANSEEAKMNNTDYAGTPWDAQMDDSAAAAGAGAHQSKWSQQQQQQQGAFSSADTSNPFDVALNGSPAFYARMLMMPTATATTTTATTTTAAPHYSTLALEQCKSEADCRSRLYLSVKMRAFDSICLQGATDADIIEFTTQAALNDGLEKFVHVSIRHSSITDKGLEVFLASIARSLQSFELIGKLIAVVVVAVAVKIMC